MRAVLLMVSVFFGCTEVANPQSCIDGSCTSSEYPYCDLEGILAPPKTCVAVECVPGEFHACRDDLAITCNTTGNNYDLVECPLGCGLNGCNPPPEEVDCTTDAQCTNPTPICSSSMTCRACALDDECSSGICDVRTGACAAASEVLYASPTGGDNAQCVVADPCSLPRAIALASSNPLRPWVKMAAGDYDRQAQTNVGTTRLVGPRTAILRGESPSTSSGTISVGFGGKLEVRGITVDLSKQAVFCGGIGTSGPFMNGGELHLDDVHVTGPTGNRVYFMNGCVGSVRRSTFTGGSGLNVSRPNGTVTTRVEVDRLHLAGSGGSQIQVASGASAMVTNSVFHDTDVLFDSGASGVLAFSTVYNARLFANGVRIENNILAAPGQTSSFVCTGCTSRSNIAFPQMATIPGTTVADPRLDAANGDLRLQATSPAVNTAMPQPDVTPGHDFDGVARPQGAAHDIGAFERLP